MRISDQFYFDNYVADEYLNNLDYLVQHYPAIAQVLGSFPALRTLQIPRYFLFTLTQFGLLKFPNKEDFSESGYQQEKYRVNVWGNWAATCLHQHISYGLNLFLFTQVIRTLLSWENGLSYLNKIIRGLNHDFSPAGVPFINHFNYLFSEIEKHELVSADFFDPVFDALSQLDNIKIIGRILDIFKNNGCVPSRDCLACFLPATWFYADQLRTEHSYTRFLEVIEQIFKKLNRYNEFSKVDHFIDDLKQRVLSGDIKNIKTLKDYLEVIVTSFIDGFYWGADPDFMSAMKKKRTVFIDYFSAGMSISKLALVWNTNRRLFDAMMEEKNFKNILLLKCVGLSLSDWVSLPSDDCLAWLGYLDKLPMREAALANPVVFQLGSVGYSIPAIFYLLTLPSMDVFVFLTRVFYQMSLAGLRPQQHVKKYVDTVKQDNFFEIWDSLFSQMKDVFPLDCLPQHYFSVLFHPAVFNVKIIELISEIFSQLTILGELTKDSMNFIFSRLHDVIDENGELVPMLQEQKERILTLEFFNVPQNLKNLVAEQKNYFNLLMNNSVLSLRELMGVSFELQEALLVVKTDQPNISRSIFYWLELKIFSLTELDSLLKKDPSLFYRLADDPFNNPDIEGRAYELLNKKKPQHLTQLDHLSMAAAQHSPALFAVPVVCTPEKNSDEATASPTMSA